MQTMKVLAENQEARKYVQVLGLDNAGQPARRRPSGTGLDSGPHDKCVVVLAPT